MCVARAGAHIRRLGLSSRPRYLVRGLLLHAGTIDAKAPVPVRLRKEQQHEWPGGTGRSPRVGIPDHLWPCRCGGPHWASCQPNGSCAHHCGPTLRSHDAGLWVALGRVDPAAPAIHQSGLSSSERRPAPRRGDGSTGCRVPVGHPVGSERGDELCCGLPCSLLSRGEGLLLGVGQDGQRLCPANGGRFAWRVDRYDGAKPHPVRDICPGIPAESCDPAGRPVAWYSASGCPVCSLFWGHDLPPSMGRDGSQCSCSSPTCSP